MLATSGAGKGKRGARGGRYHEGGDCRPLPLPERSIAAHAHAQRAVLDIGELTFAMVDLNPNLQVTRGTGVAQARWSSTLRSPGRPQTRKDSVVNPQRGLNLGAWLVDNLWGCRDDGGLWTRPPPINPQILRNAELYQNWGTAN